MRHRYIYLGLKSERRLAELGFDVVDRSGMPCDPVRRSDGKCIVSTTFATQLVRFADGTLATVGRRRLRLRRKRCDEECNPPRRTDSDE